MKKNLNNTPINSNQNIKENKQRILVLEARKVRLSEELKNSRENPIKI